MRGSAAATHTSVQAQSNSMATNRANYMAAGGNGDGMARGLPDMQQLAQNPEMIQSMMNSPMVSGCWQ